MLRTRKMFKDYSYPRPCRFECPMKKIVIQNISNLKSVSSSFRIFKSILFKIEATIVTFHSKSQKSPFKFKTNGKKINNLFFFRWRRNFMSDVTFSLKNLFPLMIDINASINLLKQRTPAALTLAFDAAGSIHRNTNSFRSQITS